MFINEFLDGDKKFEKSILETNIDFDKKNNKNIYIEKLVKETLNYYQFLFEPTYDKKNNNILELFKDPYIFIDEYPKIENLILKRLEYLEKKQKEKKRIKAERMEIINELRNQLKFYEKEYKYYNDNLKKIIEEYSYLVTSKIKDNSEIIELIRDFHLERVSIWTLYCLLLRKILSPSCIGLFFAFSILKTSTYEEYSIFKMELSNE